MGSNQFLIMKTFFLLAAAATFVSAQANPTPFNRGQVSSYDGSNRGGDPLFGTWAIPLVRLADARYLGNDGQTPIGGLPGPMFDQGLELKPLTSDLFPTLLLVTL